VSGPARVARSGGSIAIASGVSASAGKTISRGRRRWQDLEGELAIGRRSGVSRRSRPPGPLRRRDFFLVYVAATISVVGDRFAFVALPFAVLASSGSLGDVGLVVAAETASRGLFLLVGGVMADRLRRSRVMVAADVVRAGCQAALAALILAGHASLPALLALQAAHGAASAFFDPASTGLVAEVVPPAELQAANAQLSISRGMATILGPVLAGFLIVAFSPGVALAIDAASFVVSACFLVFVPGRAPARGDGAEERGMLADLGAGFAELRARPWLIMIMIASGTALMAILGTLFVLGPAVASVSLGGADSWGLVVGAFGLGSVAGGIVALRVPARHQLRAIFSVALITVPGILLLAVPAPIAVLAVAMLASGIAMSYAGTVYEVVLQQWVPPEILARLASYDWLVTTVLGSFGLALAGWCAELVGVRSTLIGAAAIVTVATVVPLASRTVRRADAEHARAGPGRFPDSFEEPVLSLPEPPHRLEAVVLLPDPPDEDLWVLPAPPAVRARPD
jgi:MFS family permease